MFPRGGCEATAERCARQKGKKRAASDPAPRTRRNCTATRSACVSAVPFYAHSAAICCRLCRPALARFVVHCVCACLPAAAAAAAVAGRGALRTATRRDGAGRVRAVRTTGGGHPSTAPSYRPSYRIVRASLHHTACPLRRPSLPACLCAPRCAKTSSARVQTLQGRYKDTTKMLGRSITESLHR